MPRVTKAKGSASGHSKFKKCVEALVSEPEAACLGGNELCCGGCGGNSDLVDSLCAFCLHSDTARRYFVANGGLEALLVASKSTNEKTVLAAFQVLQCLCCNRIGQQLVINTQPELLHRVCQAAVNSDEDLEGLQHAALMMMQQWVEDPECCLPAWLDASPPPKLPPPRILAQPAKAAGEPQPEWVHQPVIVRIAITSLLHPVLAIRKAAARLLASSAAAWHGTAPPAEVGAATQPTHTSLVAAAVADAAIRLAGAALAVIEEEEAAASLPRFDALANGNSHLLLDPHAFFNHQHKINRQKVACHALLHVVGELCSLGPVGICVLRSARSVVSTAAAIFAAAWRVSWAGRLVLPPSLYATLAISHAASLTAPFSFLQDHQSRELALDTLVLLLVKAGGVQLLADPLPKPTSQAHAAGEVAMPMPEDTPASSEEAQALQLLLDMARELLHQPSAGHVRAALTLLGHVRFTAVPDAPAATAPGADAPDVDVRLRWMQLLCDVFDAAWQSDQTDQATSASEPPISSVSQPPAEHSTSPIPRSYLMFPAADSAGAQSTQQDGQPPAASSGAASQQGAGLQLELGLGYRVLVQVLQAWKHMLDSGCAPVAAALKQTEWQRRVEMAVSHPKQLVASAGARLMMQGQGKPAGAEADSQDEAWASLELMGALGLADFMVPGGVGHSTATAGPNTSNWGQEAYAAAVTAMGLQPPLAANIMPGIEEGGPGPINADMQDFLNAFLEEEDEAAAAAGMEIVDDSGPGVMHTGGGPGNEDPMTAATAGQPGEPGSAGPDMFASWVMADPSDEEALADALTLIPDLETVSQNTAACMKYDKVGPFMRM